MKPAIKDDCTHAHVAIAVLITIFMVPFATLMHGQELPNAPQIAVKQQIPPVHKERPLLAKPGNLNLGSDDWFREHGYSKLSGIMSVLTHIDWGLNYNKLKDAGHGSRKSR